MSLFVVDASVALKWYVPEIYSQAALRLSDPDSRLMAPDLLPIELNNAVWKKLTLKELSQTEAELIVDQIKQLPIKLFSSMNFLDEAFELACVTQRTVYDSLYVAMAVRLGCRFVTADRKLYNSLNKDTALSDHILWVEDL
jgi:predicted nucleic acid-binding protein